ncbi:MAG: hypothetical protein ACJ8R9_05550 [Steroidobacteraceae bacterium]
MSRSLWISKTLTAPTTSVLKQAAGCAWLDASYTNVSGPLIAYRQAHRYVLAAVGIGAACARDVNPVGQPKLPYQTRR